MIAVDTNILVYAHRSEYPQHPEARRALNDLVDSTWAIPWPCIHEFLAVVSRANYLLPPTPIREALEQVEHLMAIPSLRLLGETNGHWAVLERLVKVSNATGRDIHDAKIAAICIQHGVRELWTADRDFSAFPELKTRNPLR